MTNSQTINNIKKLVQGKINVYQLFDLNRSFSDKELKVRYKIKKAENEDSHEALALIEIAYHILQDEEHRAVFDYYWSKQNKEEMKQVGGGILGLLFYLIFSLLKPVIWAIKNMWWLLFSCITFFMIVAMLSGGVDGGATLAMFFVITVLAVIAHSINRSNWWKSVRGFLGDKNRAPFSDDKTK